MAILKLANAGDEATLTITGAAIIEGQYGEQLQFDADDDRLYLPLSSAERQLERLGLANGKNINFGEIIGETFTFSRTPSTKPGAKPFWNINKAKNGAIPPAATPPKSAPPKQAISHSNVPNEQLPEFLRDAESQDSAELSAKVGVDLGKFSKDLALYTALTEFVTTKIAPIYGNEQGIGMSPESAVAAVATLYIQAKRTQ